MQVYDCVRCIPKELKAVNYIKKKNHQSRLLLSLWLLLLRFKILPCAPAGACPVSRWIAGSTIWNFNDVLRLPSALSTITDPAATKVSIYIYRLVNIGKLLILSQTSKTSEPLEIVKYPVAFIRYYLSTIPLPICSQSTLLLFSRLFYYNHKSTM